MHPTRNVPHRCLSLPENNPDMLGPGCLIPPPLKDLINKYCAAKRCAASEIPCLINHPPKTMNHSWEGHDAKWERLNGNPLTPVMYALTGNDIRYGRLKILVVEGETDMQGPFIVGYSKKVGVGRTGFRQWIGLGGDRDGFGRDIEAVKVTEHQNRRSREKSEDISHRYPTEESDTVVVVSDVHQNTVGPQKRKRTFGIQRDLGLFTTQSDDGLRDDDDGNGVSTAQALRTTRHKSSRTRSSARPSRNVPTVVVPPRSADFGDHTWQSLETSSSPSFGESHEIPHLPKPRSSNPRVSPVQTVAKPDSNAIIDLTSSSPELPPGLKFERATSASTLDLTSRKPASTTTVQALLTQPMTTNKVTTSKTANTGTTDKPLSQIKLEQKPASGEPVMSWPEFLNRRTAADLASSSKQAINSGVSQRVNANSREVNASVERRTSKAADNAVTPSVEAPKSDQIPGPPPTLLDMRSSTENTTTAASVARPPGKSRKQLKLQQVFVKFNSAVAHEPPRIRPFALCDTVQKLFNQARTGDVFGKASDVNFGGKLLTVEFRGSGRLPTEVYIVNEDDEEDFLKMKRALLSMDWWSEIEDGDSTSNTIVGGGLLDVRDAK